MKKERKIEKKVPWHLCFEDPSPETTWTAPESWVTASTALTTGEGLDRRERNRGQDLAGLLTVRPLSSVATPQAWTLSLFARDGSRGLGRARDHRLGGRTTGHLAFLDVGLEALKAWGLDGDALREPWMTSSWARAASASFPLRGYARFDHIAWEPEVTEQAFRAGLGGTGAGGRAGLWVGWERRAWQATAREIAAAGALAATDQLFIQLDVALNEGVQTQAIREDIRP